jgi:Protein of unknown function (DUF1501)
MSMNRRSFLKAVGAAAAAGAGLALPSFGDASEWGAIPGGSPWNHSPRKILQVILPGGCSIWENFWVTSDFDFAGYAEDVSSLDWSCGGSPSPPDQLLGFEYDQAGQEIYWGPATKPLWSSHILDHSRMITQSVASSSQSNPPHEIGLPLMVGGRGTGDTKLAGIAAAVEHRWQSVAPRDTPYSCVIAPQTGGTSLLRSLLVSTGMHPSWAKPLLLKLGLGDSALKQQLQRAGVTVSSDFLFDLYRTQYRDLLRFQGEGNPVASAGFESFDHAAHLLLKAGALDDILSDELMAVMEGEPCAVDPPDPLMANTTKTGLELAAHLLSLPHAQGGMRYVAVVDGGLRDAPGGAGTPYDTHGPAEEGGNWNAAITSSNLWNVLTHLAQIIQSPGGLGLGLGGPSTPKIDLSDTTVVITSEFTRTPTTKANGGRDHWGAGYVAVVIGDLMSRGISGALVDHAVAPGYGTRDICALQMLLAGIWPFEDEAFIASELSNTLREDDETENGVVSKLQQKFLG